MLIFINTPALTMTLGLRSLDEGGQESGRGRRTTVRGELRARRTSDTPETGRHRWWPVRSPHLAN
jgi:hypothetical protein